MIEIQVQQKTFQIISFLVKSKKHYISITLKNNEQYVMILHHEKCLTLTFMKFKNNLIKKSFKLSNLKKKIYI